MGTELQKMGLSENEPPEIWNINKPDYVVKIHRAYFESGAKAVTTNTFGANRIKLAEYGLVNRLEDINAAGVRLAREAVGEKGFVVGSIGPLGVFIEPLGDLSFDEAYDIFYEQARALIRAGADAIILETMSDLGEIRAALLAAKDAGDISVIASMTYAERERTLTGTDPETAAVVLESLGAHAVGVNCSGGPKELEKVVEILCRATNLPVLVEPNAGMPELINGRTMFKETPQSMANYSKKFVSLGAVMVGSCCGSTPEHTAAIAGELQGLKPNHRSRLFPLRAAGRSRTEKIGHNCFPVIIGERINPTGKKYLADEIREGKTKVIKADAISKEKAGAHLLDVNVGVPGVDEPALMKAAVQAVQSTVNAPLVLDSSNPCTLEAGLKAYHGKAVVNSVTAETESLKKILPLVKRYGAAVIGLCLDERGIPESAEERLKAAARILEYAQDLGIPSKDLIIDCLTLAVSAEPRSALVTLESIELVRKILGLPTVLGVSNISFGLPMRSVLNRAFLTAALERGLDAAIINPLDTDMLDAFYAGAMIAGRDKNAEHYVARFSQTVNEKKGESQVKDKELPSDKEPKMHPLMEAVIRGDRENITSLVEKSLDEKINPMDILDKYLIPALEEVGRKYEKGEYFLPQLMLSADAMQEAFKRLKPELERVEKRYRGTVVLATVKGDIHDIGKNIVAIMLKNHGFNVVDLGKNIPNETIIEAAQREKAEVIGLSALMTTTMPRMGEIIDIIKKNNLPFKVIVGGAAVTERYAREIGADGYGKDAVAAVNIVSKLMEGKI
ncbi:MAG: dihydropteroate synthase [Clostridia bacterium]|nr:dihydropteroate synthase [Clostridia bacterium]